MSDLLNIGSSALLAYRSALDTVGHNIANANTDGYSRQRVELQARAPGSSGAGYTGGGGVQVQVTTRLSDALVNQRLVSDNSAYARVDTFQQLAAQADDLLSNADTGLAQPLQKFFGAADGLAAAPASTAARQVLLSAADTLAGRFADLSSQLSGMESDINSRLTTAVDEVNHFASSIAALNDRIAAAAGAANGKPPNDLLDQRDQLITELSNRIGVSTVAKADGSVDVYTAGGQSLVLGNRAQSLGLADDAYHSGRLELTLGAGGSSINAQVSGGIVGGLLDARRELLDPAEAKLGRMALAITQNVNDLNHAGLDQRGQLGGDLFGSIAGAAYAATANSGNASAAVSITDAAAITGDDYELKYSGSAWSMISTRTGAAVALGGSGTAVDPLTAAGISITLSGSANAGDRFLIEPARQAAAQMALISNDTRDIAAAAPVSARAALANTGSGSISAPVVRDASNAALMAPVSIAFTSATTYTVNGSGSYTYAAGSDIDVNGWRLQISGAPAAGDTFSISANGANSGDNRNARALSGLSSSGVLDGGSTSITAANAALVSSTGSTAQQAALRRDAQTAIRTEAQKERDSVSGVNLDEEAADLVRFQQAYQAAARIIQVADTVFQALLQAARG